MGGGFGGKEDMTVEPYLALLVWRTRRPVRMVWSRQESLLASTKRHPFIMRYRTGATATATILAQDVDIVGDAGAYPTCRPACCSPAASGVRSLPGAERAGSSRAVFTNNVPTSAFRGFGAMQVVFGYESQMDRLADALGLVPDRGAGSQLPAKGDVLPTGERVDTGVAVGPTMHRALARLGEPPPPSGPGKVIGRGFGCNMQPYGRTIWFRDKASAWIGLQATARC